jgi:ABC-type uncharacterized transport system auxiliary subunit
MKSFGMAGLAFVLAGCVTVPQTQWHTLDMQPSGAIQLDARVVFPRPLEASSALQRSSILIQTGPTEMEYYATREWVAPVAELVTRKLAVEFGTQGLLNGDVQVSGTVLAFEQVDVPEGAEAHVQIALVATQGPRGGLYIEKVYDVREPSASTGVSDVARALSRAVERVAAELADDIGAGPNDARP